MLSLNCGHGARLNFEVESRREPDGAQQSQVVFAEAPEWATHAVVTYDGQVLTPVATTGTPTYLLPSAAGRLEADLPPSHQRWFLAQLALLAAVVFLAIPFGSRRSRRLV